MAKVFARRDRSRLSVLALAAFSLASLGGSQGPGLLWAAIGIGVLLIAAFIVSKLVRGDPYYEQNASRERRDTGAVPFSDGGGDGGG